jgi:hypothetical protein
LGFYGRNGKTGTAQSCSAGHWLLTAHTWAQIASAWAQQDSPSWVTVLLCLRLSAVRTSVFAAFLCFSPLFWFELAFCVNLKVLANFVSFPIALVWLEIVLWILSYDENTSSMVWFLNFKLEFYEFKLRGLRVSNLWCGESNLVWFWKWIGFAFFRC